MKIRETEWIDDGISVEDAIKELSKYVGLGAKIAIEYDGCSAIGIEYEREETGPEKSIRIKKQQQKEIRQKADALAQEILESGIFDFMPLTIEQREMQARQSVFQNYENKLKSGER